jgi:hypothetical protein
MQVPPFIGIIAAFQVMLPYGCILARVILQQSKHPRQHNEEHYAVGPTLKQGQQGNGSDGRRFIYKQTNMTQYALH